MTQNFKHVTKTKYGNVYQISNGFPSYKSIVLAYKKDENKAPLFINLMIHSKPTEYIGLDIETNTVHKDITTGTYHLLEHLMCNDDVMRAGSNSGVALNASTSADFISFSSEAPIILDIETGYRTKSEDMNTRIEFLKKHMNHALDFTMDSISDEEIANEIEVVVSEYKEFTSEDKTRPHKMVYDLKMALMPKLYPKSFKIISDANLAIKHRPSDVAGVSEESIRSIDRAMLEKAHKRLFSPMETFLIVALTLNTANDLMGNDVKLSMMNNPEADKDTLESLFESTIFHLFQDVIDKAYDKVNESEYMCLADERSVFGNFNEHHTLHTSGVKHMTEFDKHDYKHLNMYALDVVPRGTVVFMNYMLMDDSVEELVKEKEVAVVCDTTPIKPVTMYMYKKLYDILRDNGSLVYTIYGDPVAQFRGIPAAFNIGTVHYGLLNVGDRGDTLRQCLAEADRLYDDSINYLYDKDLYENMVDTTLENVITGRNWILERRSVINYLEYFGKKYNYESKYDLNDVWDSSKALRCFPGYKDDISAKEGFKRVNDRMKFAVVIHPDDIIKYKLLKQN
ncbi:MAG: hypothetical protein ACRC92_20465 [Peptostreptococcaceae bacterium]